MEELLLPTSLAALGTLAILEIVLGIDNVVFLAILTGKLPASQQPLARTFGLGLAAVGRVLLLLAITWVITLDKTKVFELPFAMPGAESHGGDAATDHDAQAADTHRTTMISVKDLILLFGGLFLLGKATYEIGHQLERHAPDTQPRGASSFAAVLVQIFAIDMVFSLDSVLTAVGMVNPDEYQAKWVPLAIMIAAVLLAIGVMLAFSGPISRFVNRHPSVKMLALSFLLLIGMVLVAEALHTHIPRGYIYFSMAFSLMVEMLNLRASARGPAAAPQH